MPIDPQQMLEGEPETANDRWFDAIIRHQIGLMRIAGGLRIDSIEILDATETEIRHLIIDRLRQHTRTRSPANRARLEGLVAEVLDVRRSAWEQVRDIWRDTVSGIFLAEPKFIDSLLKTVVPVEITTTLPTAAAMRQLFKESRVNGQTYAEVENRIVDADLKRIKNHIYIGIDRDEPNRQVARRIVGTAELQGRDGATAVARRNVANDTRTLINHAGNQGKQSYFDLNREILLQELYTAILDGNTTPECRGFDGDIYNVGEGPIPPIHEGCRSMRHAILDGEILGERQANPTTTKQLLREFSEEVNIPAPTSRALLSRFAKSRKLAATPRSVVSLSPDLLKKFKAYEKRQLAKKFPTSRDALPRGFKSQYDAFAAKRLKELIGTLPRKVNYDQFLRRQSKAFQDEVLGITKGKLYRDGGLTLKQFISESGDRLTLPELARFHADAFRAAGLDPDRYLKRAA